MDLVNFAIMAGKDEKSLNNFILLPFTTMAQVKLINEKTLYHRTYRMKSTSK